MAVEVARPTPEPTKVVSPAEQLRRDRIRQARLNLLADPTFKARVLVVIGRIAENRRGKKVGPHTAEHRQRIGDSLRGRKRGPLSQDLKERFSQLRKGKKFTVEHKRRLSESHRRPGRKYASGWHHTEDTKETLSKKLKGRVLTRDHIDKSARGLSRRWKEDPAYRIRALVPRALWLHLQRSGLLKAIINHNYFTSKEVEEMTKGFGVLRIGQSTPDNLVGYCGRLREAALKLIPTKQGKINASGLILLVDNSKNPLIHS